MTILSRCLRLVLISVAAGFVSAGAQSADPRATRTAARAFRQANEARILREFAGLLALPNVASDSVNIRRNAAALLEMLRRRGVDARLLEAAGSPPAVYGELRTPGATRTVVL